MQRVLVLIIVLGTVLTACNRGADETTTTTTSTTAPQPVTRTTTQPPDETADTSEPAEPADAGEEVAEPPAELPDYTIVRREGAEGGDRLVVLLDDYEYTDLVLEELVFEIAEEYAPVLEAYLIDDAAAADLVLLAPETLTDDDQTVLDEHLFVALTEGNLVTFAGPFADMGEFRLGS